MAVALEELTAIANKSLPNMKQKLNNKPKVNNKQPTKIPINNKQLITMQYVHQAHQQRTIT